MNYRLFTGIALPITLQEHVTALQAKLAKLDMPVKWEKPEKLHLTLNFLGHIPMKDVEKVKSQIQAVCRQHQSFSLSFPFMDTMYRRHESSFVYLSAGGQVEELKILQKDLAACFNNLDIPQAARFMPHVTIGKLERTDPPTTKFILDRMSEYEYEPIPELTVAKIVLYRSIVSRTGSYYEPLRQFDLG